MRVQREDEPQGGGLRIGMVVGLRNVAQRVGRSVYRTHSDGGIERGSRQEGRRQERREENQGK